MFFFATEGDFVGVVMSEEPEQVPAGEPVEDVQGGQEGEQREPVREKFSARRGYLWGLGTQCASDSRG